MFVLQLSMRTSMRLAVLSAALVSAVGINAGDVPSSRKVLIADPQNNMRRSLLRAGASASNEGRNSATSAVFVAYAPVPAPATSSSAMEVDPDAAAEDVFIRKCAVAMTVKSSDMLPTDALRKFCESTDVIMECRLQLEKPLQQLHRQGGDMQVFCHSAYDWFQQKYGMYCPSQCGKTQCKSTCEWLKQQKVLKAAGEKLQDRSDADSGSQKKLEELEAELVDARQDAEMRNQSVAQGEVNVERANATLQEDLRSVTWQQNRSSQVDDLVRSLEEKKEDFAVNITGRGETLDELNMRIDKADLGTHMLEDDKRQIQGKAGEAAAKLNELQHQLSQAEEEARVMEEMTNEEENRVEQLEQEVANATAIVAEKRANFDSAESQLAASVNDPMAKDSLEDLVRQQKKRFQDASEMFRRLDRELANKNIALEHSRQDLETHRGEVATARNATSVHTDLVESLEEQLAAKSEEVRASTNASDTMKAEASEQNRDLLDLKSEAERADRTLELQLRYQQEEHEKLETAHGNVQQSRAALNLQQAELNQKLEALATAATKLGNSLQLVDDEKRRWEADNAGLVRDREEHKANERDLEHRMPEIVRMHGLGLIQLLED